MHGGIISTNQNGLVQVNGGLGQVTVDNGTGDNLLLKNINVGSLSANNALSSSVEIWDTYQPEATNTSWYIYTPSQGIAEYVTSDGAQYTAANSTGSVNSNTTTYQPLTGPRLGTDRRGKPHSGCEREVTAILPGSVVNARTWYNNPNNPDPEYLNHSVVQFLTPAGSWPTWLN